MVQRPDTGLLGGLWELPNVMFHEMSLIKFRNDNNLETVKHLPRIIKHQYTHFKVEFKMYSAKMEGKWRNTAWQNAKWMQLEDVRTLAIPGVHIKAFKLLDAVKWMKS